jgi:hypothetical protein
MSLMGIDGGSHKSQRDKSNRFVSLKGIPLVRSFRDDCYIRQLITDQMLNRKLR